MAVPVQWQCRFALLSLACTATCAAVAPSEPSALTMAAAAAQDPELGSPHVSLSRLRTLPSSAPDYFWRCKNGDLNHTGAQPLTLLPAGGPPAKLTWRWTSDYPNDVVRATPLIDSEFNVFIATVTSGRVLKFAPNGTELWRYSSVGAPYDNAVPPDGFPDVPALMDGSLYVITYDGTVVSLDMASGAERWRVRTGDTALSCFSVAAGFGVVIVPTVRAGSSTGENRLLAFDAHGRKLWQTDLPGASKLANLTNPLKALNDGAAFNMLVSLVMCPEHGPVALLADTCGTTYKLALSSGDVLWRVEGPGSFSTGGAIVGPDDTVYVTTVFGDGASSVTTGDPESHPLGPVARGIVSAYELSGGRLKWRTDLGVGNESNNAPTIGRLDGPGAPLRVVVAAGPNPFTAQNRELADGTTGAPLPARTIALDAATGVVVWVREFPTWHGAAAGDSTAFACRPDSSANAAIGSDGAVYVPHEDGRLYVMRDADANGEISEDEVATHDFGFSFQGAPALAPGMLAVAPCDGLAVWVAM